MFGQYFKKLEYYTSKHIFFRQCRLSHKSPENGDLSRIRNIGILAHIDAGKTTTTERLLYYSGKIAHMGEVHKGNTVTDYMEQERNRGITITSACVTFKWNNNLINLVDTPGHIDFTVEVEQALNVIDSAVVVLDGTAGVEVQTVTVWRQADKKSLPRLAYANKMDRPDSDINLCETSLREKLSVRPFVLHLPVKDKSGFNSIVDLISLTLHKWTENKHITQKLTPSDNTYPSAVEKRNQLIDDLSAFDDKLADAILSSGTFDAASEPMLKESIRRVTLNNHGVPVICGSSYKNVGIELLLDSINDFLPSPLDTIEHGAKNLFNDDFIAKAFKVMHDKQKGPLVFFRIYSGCVNKGQKVFDYHEDQSDQVGYLYKPFADELTEVNSAKPGDFVAASGLKIVQNGHIICSSGTSAKRLKELGMKHETRLDQLLRGSHVPNPVVFRSIEPPSLAYLLPLEKALAELCREDPSLKVTHDIETGQTVIGGMGELHLEIIKDRLLTEYKIDADLGPLQIVYKEMPIASVKETHTLKNVLGSNEFQVSITLSLKQGTYKDILRLDTTKEAAAKLAHLTPRQIASIKKGIISALRKGPLMSSEVIDCYAVLHDLEVNKRVPEPVLIAAASQCIDKILKQCETCLLEPIMEVYVAVDESLFTSVQSDLARRRADITEITSRNNCKEITCDVPLSELLGYSKHLRTATSGSARFTMEFKNYRQMNLIEQDKVLKNLI